MNMKKTCIYALFFRERRACAPAYRWDDQVQPCTIEYRLLQGVCHSQRLNGRDTPLRGSRDTILRHLTTIGSSSPCQSHKGEIPGTHLISNHPKYSVVMPNDEQPLVGVLALQGAFEEHQQCLEAIGCRTIQVHIAVLG